MRPRCWCWASGSIAARLRWLSMTLYGVSVVKLFLVDMANVQQLYRILAFFVLAVVLGLVARTYQRFK